MSKLSKRIKPFLLFFCFSLGTAAVSADETVRVHINGATCKPDLNIFDPTTGSFPILHYLYAIKGSATCHFPITPAVTDHQLSHVVLRGKSTSSSREGQALRYRLCIYGPFSEEPTCAPIYSMTNSSRQATIHVDGRNPDFHTNFDFSRSYDTAAGMFVQLFFPSDKPWEIFYLTAYFDEAS